MSNSSSNSGGGIGIFGLTFIVFLVLKLCSVITWSWWWVTVPLWGGLGIMLGVLLIAVVIGAIMVIVKGL